MEEGDIKKKLYRGVEMRGIKRIGVRGRKTEKQAFINFKAINI